MAHYDTLHFAAADGIGVVTFDHPPVNVMSLAMMADLDAVLDELTATPKIRVLVLESADPEFFVAHGDMTSADDPTAFMTAPIALDQDTKLNPMMRLYEKLRTLPQVTIVKLRGLARGGGAELASAADIRFGSERAGLSQMEAPGGILPGAGGTVHLPRLIGRARALEVVLGAELIDAHTAQQWGWLNRVVPDDELDALVDRFARRVASLPPGVVEATTAAIDTTSSMPAALTTANSLLGELFARPAATIRTRALLNAGAQTRDGERRLEMLIESLDVSD